MVSPADVAAIDHVDELVSYSSAVAVSHRSPLVARM